MDLKNLPQSKSAKLVLGLIIGLVVLLLVFQAGVSVGYRKAMFSSRLGDNYRQAFGPGRGDFGPGMMGSGFFPGPGLPGGHGAAGTVVRVDLPSLVVADRDKVEKIITVASTTDIRSGRAIASSDDLKVGDSVVVLGAPDQAGNVVARLIRILSR